MKLLNKLLCLSIPLSIVLSGCGNKPSQNYADPNKDSLELHLTFDEQKGTMVNDATKKHQAKSVSYAILDSDTLSTKPTDVLWKEHGAVNGALLFDGYSTWITYDSSEIAVGGSQFSISAWVAPRAYDWDDINAVSNDSENLTGIVSQYYRDDSYSMGMIFGYHREGAWTFQCGLGNSWVEIWDEGTPLSKYEWNHITATFDGINGKISLYMNGKIVNVKEIPVGSSIQIPDMPLLVGKNNISRSSGSCTQAVVSGLLDDIRLYKTVLSNSDIKDYYNFYTVDGKANEIAFSDIWLQDALTDDVYKTQFHGGPYQHWMNEPHAPIYYKGIYHLFFQFNILGPYFNSAAGIAWGHLVSEDMVNWKPIKEAIVPTKGTVCPDGVWSGGSTYATVNGVDNVPVLLFTAGNYAHPGMVSNQNIGLATPKDPSDPYLTEWEVSDKLAIEQKSGQGKAGEFRDAHVWIENDTYYLAVGSSVSAQGRGCVLLYTSSMNQKDPLHNWTYRGMLYDWKEQTSNYGRTWELPVILPLSDENGKATGKYVLIISPAPADTADNNIVYWIGTFNKSTYRFTPDWQGAARRMDYGRNVFTGPSGFIDPNTGLATIFSIMQDQRDSKYLAASGWAHCVGLARHIYLGEDKDLHIKPVAALDSLKEQKIFIENSDAETVNKQLAKIKSDMLYIKVKFTNMSENAVVGVKTRMTENKEEYTKYYYDNGRKVIGADTKLNKNNSALTDGIFEGSLSDSSITMELFVDRSMIEGFFNNYKTISTRSYTGDHITNLSEVFIENGTASIELIEVSIMKSIHK